MPFAFSLSVKDAFNTSVKYDLQFLHLLKYIYILWVFPSLFLKQTDFFSSAIDEDGWNQNESVLPSSSIDGNL